MKLGKSAFRLVFDKFHSSSVSFHRLGRLPSYLTIHAHCFSFFSCLNAYFICYFLPQWWHDRKLISISLLKLIKPPTTTLNKKSKNSAGYTYICDEERNDSSIHWLLFCFFFSPRYMEKHFLIKCEHFVLTVSDFIARIIWGTCVLLVPQKLKYETLTRYWLFKNYWYFYIVVF